MYVVITADSMLSTMPLLAYMLPLLQPQVFT